MTDVLMVVAARHDATTEIAERIATVLRSRLCDLDEPDPDTAGPEQHQPTADDAAAAAP